jgi:SAM-dependent methyltransferase
VTEWFEQWFGEEYHTLYPHRDTDDARHAVALVERIAHWTPGGRVLDLACGAGRHAAELERAGACVVGLDLSSAMLRRARSRTRATLVRGDMRRLPFRPGSFEVAVNLFTSFGYFRDDGEHGLVVRQVAEALVRGGRFVLDYLNADEVRRALRRDTEEIPTSPAAVQVRRRLSAEGRYVVKEIEMRDEGRSFQERVRLYTVAELTALLEGAGFRVLSQFGDYDGRPFAAGSPRAILLGERV